MNKPSKILTPTLWIEGLFRRPWQHAHLNAKHPDGVVVFECRQSDDSGQPLGFIECRAIVGNRAVGEPKIFKSLAALKENWDW